MSEYQAVKYEVINQVARIGLNQPETLNAVSQQMRGELKQAIDAAEEDDNVRIVILYGEGRGFSSGTSIPEGLAGYDDIDQQIQTEYRPIVMGIADSSKIYISAINGACAGVSTAIAMNCDLTVMSEDAFLYLAFAPIALVTDGGLSHALVRALGYKRAYQIFIEGGRLAAKECVEAGLANKVVANDKLLDETQAWAEKLAKGSPYSQKFGKQIMRAALHSDYESIFNLESKHQVTCTESEDYKAATEAFFAKKAVEFKGR